MSSTIKYDRPQFFSQTQVRGVFQPNQTILSPTMKMLDMEIITDVPAYLPPTLGIYAIIDRIQVLLNGKIIDINSTHKDYLSYILPTLADNQTMKDKLSVVHGTGAVKYDQTSKMLTMEKVKVSTLVEKSYKFEVILSFLSNLLSQIGIVQDKMEIIIDFVPNIAKVLIPVDPTETVTTASVSMPYFSYECLQGDYKQPESVEFVTYVGDVLTVPAITSPAVGVNQKVAIRTNAFNNKTLTKVLMSQLPQSFLSQQPSADALKIYNNFNRFCSVPMCKMWWNMAYDGKNIIDFTNVENQAYALALATMALGEAHTANLAHIHSVKSPLVELQNAQGDSTPRLNGWFGFSALEVNRKVEGNLTVQLYREAQSNTDYPTLNEQLAVSLVGMVKTALVKGNKVYL